MAGDEAGGGSGEEVDGAHDVGREAEPAQGRAAGDAFEGGARGGVGTITRPSATLSQRERGKGKAPMERSVRRRYVLRVYEYVDETVIFPITAYEGRRARRQQP